MGFSRNKLFPISLTYGCKKSMNAAALTMGIVATEWPKNIRFPRAWTQDRAQLRECIDFDIWGDDPRLAERYTRNYRNTLGGIFHET